MDQLDTIADRSKSTVCMIFKHSTRCSISSVAKNRLESKWKFEPDEVEPYFLDLLRHRDISDAIAAKFHVHHESPQIILLSAGDCILDASHLDITVDEIAEQLGQLS